MDFQNVVDCFGATDFTRVGIKEALPFRFYSNNDIGVISMIL